MKSKFTIVKRIIAALFIIFTMIIMIIFFKDIQNAYTLNFVRFYLVLIIIMDYCFSAILYMKTYNLKCRKIIKFLLGWIILSITMWSSFLLIDYLIDGKLMISLRNITRAIGTALGMVIGQVVFVYIMRKD